MFRNFLFCVSKISLQWHLFQWAGVGETRFHFALSAGVVPFGPIHKAVSVKVRGNRSDRSSWLTARKEGLNEVLDGERILHDIYDEVTLKFFEGCRTSVSFVHKDFFAFFDEAIDLIMLCFWG